MIKKLRRKFILILMSVVTFILVLVFLSLLIATSNNNIRMNENLLRQSLFIPSQRQSPPPQSGVHPVMRMPIMIAKISDSNEISIEINQLHFIEGKEGYVVQSALKIPEKTGVLKEYDLRFLKSEDGLRIAFMDISMEQEMLNNLILNSLPIGFVAIVVFFFISMVLARWAVKPAQVAWERQQRFVADASHELKTPLTVILSNAEMLEGAFEDGKKARRLEHIRAETVRMRKLVDDLLLLAKSDNMIIEKFHDKVDLSYVLKSAILTFDAIIYDEQKELTFNVSDKLVINGDKQRLEQLIGILLDNACKYCPSGGKIEVNLKELDKKFILLSVYNDGEPIPQSELDQIFLRFYRVDKSRSSHGSFGLGLAIAESITKEHGGKIWAESKPISGNTFLVKLPQISSEN